jgi:hypothetical protein
MGGLLQQLQSPRPRLELQLSAFLARKHVQARLGDQADLSPLLIKVSGSPKQRRWLNARWRTKPVRSPACRRTCSATVLKNGSVLIAHGADNSAGRFASAHAFWPGCAMHCGNSIAPRRRLNCTHEMAIGIRARKFVRIRTQRNNDRRARRARLAMAHPGGAMAAMVQQQQQRPIPERIAAGPRSGNRASVEDLRRYDSPPCDRIRAAA